MGCLTPAIDEIINYHHRLPAARAWGDGTFASSDGQRFPVQVKAANAGALPRYFGFGRGLSVLTSVTDHYATFGTKVIPTRVREGLHALDEIFALRDRDSELTIAEHTTDTAGFTDLLFGAYDVVGLFFCPASAIWPTSACGCLPTAPHLGWWRRWWLTGSR